MTTNALRTVRLWQKPELKPSEHILVEHIYGMIEDLGVSGLCFKRLDLRFYQRNPHKIPPEWIGKRIYAFGTRRIHSRGEDYVIFLDCVNYNEQSRRNFKFDREVYKRLPTIDGLERMEVVKKTDFRPEIKFCSTMIHWDAKDRVVYLTRFPFHAGFKRLGKKIRKLLK